MAKNTEVIPFTELVERIQEITRERSSNASKIRGVVNDIYLRDIPRKEDWSFYLASSAITLIEEFATGTVSANTGDTTVTFSSEVVMTSSMTGRMLKMTGNDYVYRVSGMSGNTGATITPPISGNANITSVSYSIFQPFYSLASDFDRFPKNGGLINYRGNSQEIIPEKPYQEWPDEYTATPQNDPSFCRLIGADTAGNTLLEIVPPAKIAKSLRYDYFLRPRVMRESTAGLIGNITSGGVNVIGDSNTLFTQMNTGDYLRVDALGKSSESEWYRIIAISGNSGLTLQTAFGLSGVTSANYTICSAPQMPPRMHPAVLYGTITQIVADQDDPLYSLYAMKYAEVMTDGKRIYKTRNYNQDIHHIGEEYYYRY